MSSTTKSSKKSLITRKCWPQFSIYNLVQLCWLAYLLNNCLLRTNFVLGIKAKPGNNKTDKVSVLMKLRGGRQETNHKMSLIPLDGNTYCEENETWIMWKDGQGRPHWEGDIWCETWMTQKAISLKIWGEGVTSAKALGHILELEKLIWWEHREAGREGVWWSEELGLCFKGNVSR